MKKILTLLIITLALTVQAQDHADFLKLFKGNKDYTCVTISRAALRMMPVTNVNGMNMTGIASKLNSLIVVESNTKSAAKRLMNEIDNYVNKLGCEPVLDVDDQGETDVIYYKESSPYNIFILKSYDESDKDGDATVLILTGAFTINEMQGLVKDMAGGYAN